MAVAKKIPLGSRLADIGSDHAYLPIYLVSEGIVRSAIATDVNRGPVKNAEENIKAHGFEEKISARLGDGMEGLDSSEYDTVSVCGMGGELIFRIINNDDVKSLRPNLILQPMSSIEDLSYLLAEHGYEIYDDEWVIEGEHIYRIMCVRYTAEPYKINEIEAYAGAINLKRGDEGTVAYVKRLKKQTQYRLGAKSKSENSDASEEKRLLELIDKYLSERGIIQ